MSRRSHACAWISKACCHLPEHAQGARPEDSAASLASHDLFTWPAIVTRCMYSMQDSSHSAVTHHIGDILLWSYLKVVLSVGGTAPSASQASCLCADQTLGNSARDCVVKHPHGLSFWLQLERRSTLELTACALSAARLSGQNKFKTCLCRVLLLQRRHHLIRCSSGSTPKSELYCYTRTTFI